MRPIELEIEGLTSFRERATLGLEALDLFAITGPTGAGKTSVVDAMLWALFGQVPRVGKEYRQLLSHGSPRIAVRLDFAAGSERYRVARSATAKGRLQVRLERLVPRPDEEGAYDTEPLADRATDVAARLERIVGLDYHAFVRAVVLPQGEFDRFLKGEPGERRAILASLLDLHVYEHMAALARRQASQARGRADLLSDQLQRDFAGATPVALSELRASLDAARARGAELRAGELSLGKLATLQRGLDDARSKLAQLRSEQAAADEAARVATASRRQAAGEAERLSRAIEDVDRGLATSTQDEARSLALAELRLRVAHLRDARGALERLASEVRAARDQLASLSADCEEGARLLAAAETDVQEHDRRLDAARADLERQRQRDMARTLRQGLQLGEPCPVCDHPVEHVRRTPPDDGTIAAQGAVESATRAAHTAQQRLTTARQRLTQAEAAHAAALAAVADREGRLGEAQGDFEAQRTELLGRDITATELADPAALGDRIESEWQDLQTRRRGAEDLRDRRRILERELAAARQELGTGEARQTMAEGRVRELEAQIAGASSALCTAQDSLDAACPADARPTDLDAALRDVQRQATEAAAQEGRLAAEVEHVEMGIARAAEIARERDELSVAADTAHALARALQADAFMAFVQEEALQRLAADGTARLAHLSHGRYSLRCADDEFVVVDHWNADTERSVRTLSGGETFLASLALALALADRVTELSSGPSGQVVLESLFLDEGFGTLDADALDVAASALESLQDGHRMVGVITHLDALAERLPVRVVVAPGEHGATLTVVSS